jgi:hypothetical protein
MITPEQLAAAGSESAHQKGLFAWLAIQPDPRLKLAFAIPNGGKRDKITAARMKAEGAKAGVWDIFLPVAVAEGYHGLFIEMKKPGETTSKEQDDFQVNLMEYGNYAFAVCYSWEEARDALINYIKS